MAVTRINPEYDDRTISAGFRRARDAQTQTGRLQQEPESTEPNYRTELVYGQPGIVGAQDQGPWAATANRKKVQHKEDKVSVEEKLLARVRVSVINTWVEGWAVFWYLSFQWWMSLISLSGLGIGYAAYSIVSSIEETTLGGALSYFIGDSESAISGEGITSTIIAAAFSIIGIKFDPMYLFIVPSAVLLLLGTLNLLVIWSIYRVAGINSLSGQAMGLKGIAFVSALISSMTPIPLIFLWLAVVWKYPK